MGTDCKQRLLDERLRIALRLQQAGLARWIEAAWLWVERFSGVERWIAETELAPSRCVLRLALRYRRQAPAPSDTQVAAELAALPFIEWQAKWPPWTTTSGRAERWRPLVEPFKAFEIRYPASTGPIVWQSSLPSVGPHEASNFLRQELHELAGRAR